MNNNHFIPISIINCEQIMKLGYPHLTIFSRAISQKLNYSKFEVEKYYLAKGHRYPEPEIDKRYILLESSLTDMDKEKLCFSTEVTEHMKTIPRSDVYYKERYIEQIFGIIPVISYNYVLDIAIPNGKYNCYYVYNTREYTNKAYYDIEGVYYDEYILGYYPKKKIAFTHEDDYYNDIIYLTKDFNESMFKITKDKISLPSIIDDKVIIKEYNIYQAKTLLGDIKEIKYYGEWFAIEPIKWLKIGDNLVCEDILFTSPVHMKNDYIKNDDIHSLDDTFLKWYIDNIFTQDLFKYTNLSFSKGQISNKIDEEINLKLREIEKLKQLKSKLIVQQSKENINNNNIHKNIERPIDEEDKLPKGRVLHKK